MSLPRALLIQHALALTEQLQRFKTPTTGEPVDPSIPAQVLRYVQTRPTLPELHSFLSGLPASSVGMLTRSSGPQTQEVVRRVRDLVAVLSRQAAEPEVMAGLAVVLAWTRRMLVASERGVRMA